ncbi:MAG: aldehyde dehydrogenase family protein, partial [Pseudoclavibacter sp.]
MTATLFIDGRWEPAASGETRTITCPADGTEVGVVSEAGAADAERAIAAARRAFDGGEWASTSASERGAFLARVADELGRRKAEFARAEALDTGKRLVEAEIDMDDIIGCFRHFAKLADA